LNAGGVTGVEGLVVQDHVTEGIQQAAGEILQAAEQLQGCPSELGRQVAQQTAGFHQLLDHVGDLQQVVVGFELFRDNSVSVHHYCFPCIKSVSWIHGKTSKTDRR